MVERMAYVDAKEARAFAQDLGAATEFYSRAIDRLDSHMTRLGKTWRDRQFEEFRDEVKTLREGLVRYISETKDARSHLDRLAAHAEELERHRLR